MRTVRSLFSFFAIICLISHIFSVSPSNADTITALSCSRNDVNNAISAASSGDTVLVPAGSSTWNSQLSISKSITLKGAGADETVITSNVPTSYSGYLISYTAPASDNVFRITGFTFDLNRQSQGVALVNSTTTYRTIRLDHNKFTNCYSATYPTIVINGTFKGVIDNNNFSGYPHFDNYGVGGGGKDSWNNLTFTHGTEENVYWEDNIFTMNHTALAAFTSGGHGGRYVCRYNNYFSNVALYPVWDFHGNQQRGVFGTMGFAAYGNKITMTNNSSTRITGQRGGKAIVYFNKVVTTGTVIFDLYEQWADAYDSYTRTNYPCPSNNINLYDGEYGCAEDGQPDHVSDSYYWNNRQNTTLKNCTQNPSFLGTLVENVHWWNHDVSFTGATGMGCGTLATMQAIETCTEGVGYWATDQSCSDLTGMVGANPTTPIDGTFYKCTATNTWTEYYTPYTYPHPLRDPDPEPQNSGIKVIIN